MPDTPIPLMSGPWKPLDGAESAQVLERLDMALTQTQGMDAFPRRYPISGLRALPLSFYPGWLLLEGEAQLAANTMGTFNVLYGPGMMWVIDGDSSMIHELNAGSIPRDMSAFLGRGKQAPSMFEDKPPAPRFIASPLALLADDVTASDYLRFFCSAVWANEGPFYVLESLDSPLLRNMDVPAQVKERCRPLVAKPDGDSFLINGLVAYGRGVFEARFRLEKTGHLEMLEDEPLVADWLPVQFRSSPFRHVRMADGTPRPPPLRRDD